ncbi:hypothetical protein, partial [Oceanithermus sp.]
ISATVSCSKTLSISWFMGYLLLPAGGTPSSYTEFDTGKFTLSLLMPCFNLQLTAIGRLSQSCESLLVGKGGYHVTGSEFAAQEWKMEFGVGFFKN